ncbi:MAG TPA: NAD-dependent epimerase/dehydratase family protein, partial [Ktedonobacteraceae bacterium]|nr:NAD-dependent epimerase/dehydratase family protein [Ktedonobacteraceae bacterium]
MKILVTGGAGYIGSVVSMELLTLGYEVVILDNLSKGHRGAIPKNAEFICGDLADVSCLNQVFAKNRISGVMHFAASIEVGESMQEPERYFE